MKRCGRFTLRHHPKWAHLVEVHNAETGAFVGCINKWDGYGLGPRVPLYVRMVAGFMMRGMGW